MVETYCEWCYLFREDVEFALLNQCGLLICAWLSS
jgi:hypothetical protein